MQHVACAHTAAYAVGASDARCVWLLQPANLHASRVGEAGWAAVRKAVQQLVLNPFNREAQRQPELQQLGQAQVH
jgi:hypothetical protein